MYWHFDELPPSVVDQEVTQLEQFQNEDIDLPETLVRESIQNSLDAKSSTAGHARIRFAFVGGNQPEPEFMRRIFEGHLEHAEASDVDLSEIDFAHPSALVIEDFGTSGLTGKVDSWDEGKFYFFWRCRGKSNKSATQQGRRGLGKLVFPASSRLRAFFGLTIPEDSGIPFLMGQTVLKSRRMNGRRYPPDAFFCCLNGLPVPLTDKELLEEFQRQFKLRRGHDTGLSIVIPFPVSELGLERMISAGILGFFIPILHGQLVLEFGDILIDAQNVLDVARKYCGKLIPNIDALFTFIMETREKMKLPVIPEPNWFDNGKLTEKSFSEKDLERMKSDLSEGRTVAARMPILISRKDGKKEEAHFFVFLKKPQELSKGQDFYVRSGLNIPGESRFGERRALGLLLAEDRPVAEFLGDAENPAHYKWNGRSETLRKKYRNPDSTLRIIRNALIGLHDLLTQSVEEQPDEVALRDFFWIPGHQTGKGGTRATTSPQIAPELQREKYRIHIVQGGFIVKCLKPIPLSDLPFQIVITVAYDTIAGNPFRLYSEYDFDFSRPGDISIEVAGANVESEKNRITCNVDEQNFSIRVTGFDPNRDLVVRLEE